MGKTNPKFSHVTILMAAFRQLTLSHPVKTSLAFVHLETIITCFWWMDKNQITDVNLNETININQRCKKWGCSKRIEAGFTWLRMWLDNQGT